MKKNAPLPESIGNRYSIESSIGEGGMGTVYKAHDPLLNITVAIKQMHQVESPDALIRFQNEAVALAKLNHPNIAKVLDFAYDEGVTYMVMEYLDGESYATKLKRQKLSLLEHVSIFVQIAQGLVHAHKKGVLHRDLKPSNVMIVNDTTGGAPSPVVKIVDFGIAKLHGGDAVRLTTTNALVGSPLYMSPEQAQGRNVDSRSEVYSFGCLMFEALKGHVPLKGDNYLETINMHIETPAPRLNSSTKNPEFPEEIDNLIFRCLKKSPDERVQSAAQLVTELEEIHESLVAEELERQEALEREAHEGDTNDDGVSELQLSKSSNQILIGGTIGFLILIVGITFYMYQNANKQRPAAKEDPLQSELYKVALAPQVQTKKLEKLLEGRHNYDPAQQILQISGVGSEVEMQDIKELRLPIMHLKLISCDVQGKFFELVNRDTLKTLTLQSTKIDDQGLQLVSKFKNVYAFQSSDNENLRSSNYSQLVPLKQLSVLYIDPADGVTDQLFHDAQWKELGILNLAKAAQITDKSVNDLNKLTKIFNIGLTRSGLTADGLARLIIGHKLVMLNLDEAPFNDNTCNSIVKQPKLNWLALKRLNRLNSKNFKDICTIKTIAELEIDCRNVDKEALCSLKELPGLKKLSLFGPKWSDELLESLASMNLESLKIDESDMPVDQVSKFARMKQLKQLELIHFEEKYETALNLLEESTAGRISGKFVVARPGADAARFLGNE